MKAWPCIVALLLAPVVSACSFDFSPTQTPSSEATVVTLACEEATARESARAERAARVTRGGESEISSLATVEILGYRMVAATVTHSTLGPDALHPYPFPYQLVWITNGGSFFSEVSENWRGDLPDGNHLDSAVAQQARSYVLSCSVT